MGVAFFIDNLTNDCTYFQVVMIAPVTEEVMEDTQGAMVVVVMVGLTARHPLAAFLVVSIAPSEVLASVVARHRLVLEATAGKAQSLGHRYT